MSDQVTQLREINKPERCSNKCVQRDGVTPSPMKTLANQGVRTIKDEHGNLRTRSVAVRIRICEKCGEQVSRTEEVL